MKQKITLSIFDRLIEKVEIEAVLEKRNISEITEELYGEF